jgi:hypothetical protein
MSLSFMGLRCADTRLMSPVGHSRPTGHALTALKLFESRTDSCRVELDSDTSTAARFGFSSQRTVSSVCRMTIESAGSCDRAEPSIES